MMRICCESDCVRTGKAAMYTKTSLSERARRPSHQMLMARYRAAAGDEDEGCATASRSVTVYARRQMMAWRSQAHVAPARCVGDTLRIPKSCDRSRQHDGLPRRKQLPSAHPQEPLTSRGQRGGRMGSACRGSLKGTELTGGARQAHTVEAGQ